MLTIGRVDRPDDFQHRLWWEIGEGADGRLDPFLFDRSPNPEQAPPPGTIGHLDQWRKLAWGETRKDDLGAGKVPPADLLGSSFGPGTHKVEDPYRTQVRKPCGEPRALLDCCRLFRMLIAPPEPPIRPPAVAEPIIPDDEHEREAQARRRGNESQGHGSHVPESHDIGVEGCQHALHLYLVVLFDDQRLLQGRIQAG